MNQLKFSCRACGIDFESIGYDNPVFGADKVDNCPKCGGKCWEKEIKIKYLEHIKLTDELEKLQEKMHEIKIWINSYPLSIFPKPDFEKAHEVLKQHGMSLDAISANNMRHVLDGVKTIIEAHNH